MKLLLALALALLAFGCEETVAGPAPAPPPSASASVPIPVAAAPKASPPQLRPTCRDAVFNMDSYKTVTCEDRQVSKHLEGKLVACLCKNRSDTGEDALE